MTMTVKNVRNRVAKRPPPRAKTIKTGGTKPAAGSKARGRAMKKS